MKRVTPDLSGEQDDEAEYDSPKTLQAIREAIASYGHEVVDLEATQDLPLVLASTPVDVVFNIAEGFKGRSREVAGAVAAGAAGHPLHRLGSSGALGLARQGAGQADGAHARDPHARTTRS